MKKTQKELKRLAAEAERFKRRDGAYIERTSAQVAQQSKKLAEKVIRSGALSSKRGHLLLASKGFDTDGLARGLQSLQLKASSLEPVEPLRSTDVEGFLRHQHEMILLTAIEEAKRETTKNYLDSYYSYLRTEWTTTKQDLIEALGQRVDPIPQLSKTPGRYPTNQQTSRFNSPILGQRSNSFVGNEESLLSPKTPQASTASSQMDAKMIQYAKVVETINEFRLMGHPFPMLTSGEGNRDEPAGYIVTAQRFRVPQGAQRHKELVECWRMLRFLVGSGTYDAPVLRRDAGQLRWRLIQGAREFLEEQYTFHISNFIKQHSQEARLGGDVSMRNRIETFLRLRNKAHGGELSWQLIYYALRCGDKHTALEIARQHPKFLPYLEAFLQRGSLHESEWGHLLQMFNTEVRISGNPHKIAVFNIVGKCDVSSPVLKPIFETTADYLWYTLSLLRESLEALPQQFFKYDYTIDKLHATLSKYPPEHWSQPLLYFQVLVLSQQFDKAVAFLMQTPYYVDAVHFATVFDEFHLIDGALMEKIVRQYVRPFTRSDPKIVLAYLLLIKDSACRNRAIRAFVLDSQEYDVLLGSTLPNGQIRPGCLDTMMRGSDVQEIIESAAGEAERNGRFVDAIRLFDLCGAYDRVLQIINGQLSEQLTQFNAPISKIAESIAKKYTVHQTFHRIHPAIVFAFDQLQRLERFFRYYRTNEFDPAFSILGTLRLFPNSADDTIGAVENFKALDPAIKRNFSEVLLATMHILKHFYETQPESRAICRERSRALITFVGKIQFKMPTEVYSTLSRFDCLMS